MKLRRGRPQRLVFDRLIGSWSGQFGGQPATLDFDRDGHLSYFLRSQGKTDVAHLTWRVDGDFLVTNQPSHPREERTRYWFDREDLILGEGSGESRFTRTPA